MTWPTPRLNVKGCARSKLESNFFPEKKEINLILLWFRKYNSQSTLKRKKQEAIRWLFNPNKGFIQYVLYCSLTGLYSEHSMRGAFVLVCVDESVQFWKIKTISGIYSTMFKGFLLSVHINHKLIHLRTIFKENHSSSSIILKICIKKAKTDIKTTCRKINFCIVFIYSC